MDDTKVTMIAGGISLVLSGILIYYYWRAKSLLNEMWAVDTYTARELKQMCSGGFDATVEVTGNMTCDNPVIAPASQFPCCWCRTIVERQVRKARSGSGLVGVRVSIGADAGYSWEKVYDQTLTAIFKVHDETGYVLVDPTNADVDTENPYTLVTEGKESWMLGVPESETGQYRIKEEILMPEGDVYVLGQASSTGDNPDSDALVHYPDEGYMEPGHRFFVISRKSEKELTESKELSLKLCFWVGVLGFFLAAYCALHLLRVLP